MADDHGTLRDADGKPKVYKALGPDSVPLAEAMVWPDDMTDWEAARYAAGLEFGRATPGPWMLGPVASRMWRYPALRGCVPLAACSEDHAAHGRCPQCRAER